MAQPGGVTEHVSHLRDEFNRLGHDVTVMAPRGQKGGMEVSDGYYGIGRTITIPGNGSRMKLTFDVTLYADVKAIMKREKFDIVHLHEPLLLMGAASDQRDGAYEPTESGHPSHFHLDACRTA